jgi:DNA-binding PadR family transcriptional regulator
VHGIDTDTLDALEKAGFATVDVEYTNQGIEIVRYHITDAGRYVLDNNQMSQHRCSKTLVWFH